MKNLITCAIFAASASMASAATIEQVIVRQQWPWSTDIKVEYKLADVTKPVDLTIRAYNGETELSLPAKALTGDRYGISEDGVGQIMIDPVTAFGTSKVALANFKVKLSVADSPENMNEVLYKIFDLTTGACEEVTRKALLNGDYGAVETDFSQIGAGYNTTLTDVVIWTGVTNYPGAKTTKLVMRKIPAANKVWQIGSPTTEPGRAVQDTEAQQYVKLSEDYFVGVFEMTQSQYNLIVGSNPSKMTAQADAAEHPVEYVHYSSVRGDVNNKGPSGELINWPTNSTLHEIVSSSTLGKLRTKCGGVEFDLPTDAQWEFACRAGTTTSLNDGIGLASGSTVSVELDKLGWYSDNSAYDKTRLTEALYTNQTHAVGLKRPNAFGLYDMHGNIAELLANWEGGVGNATSGTGATSEDPLLDPLGPIRTGGARQTRGGCYCSIPGYCRSASRRVKYINYYDRDMVQGFRVVCPTGTTW